MKTSMYSVDRIDGIDHLKRLFPTGQADEMNFCLFSTSGVHGHYLCIEDLFTNDGEGGINETVTVLVIRPRIVHMMYGTIKVPEDDIEYLKKLRQSSWDYVQNIGKKR